MILKPKNHSSKHSTKNPLDLVYAAPQLDEKKLLGHSIPHIKDPRDSVLKKRIVKVYRHGKEICVMARHPQFPEAKREEKLRLKNQKRQVALEAKKKAEKVVTKSKAEKPATITETEKLEEPRQKIGKRMRKET